MSTNATERRIVQNFVLIWLSDDIDKPDVKFQNAIIQLRRFANIINIFTDPDQCVDFLSELTNEKAYVIISGTLEQRIVPLIHDISQLDLVYIFCENTSQEKQWIQEWSKVKGVFTQISPMCDSLQAAIRQCNQDSISISFIPIDSDLSNLNLDQIDQFFMYTQILKEILLEIDYGEQSIKDLATYCRDHYEDNLTGLNDIARFEQDYSLHSPIWWYTYSGFLYSMVNRALRNQEVDIIMKSGFFIRDLHQHIRKLHQKQSAQQQTPFIVYRGQGLSTVAFEKLLKTKDGLMSFNNFLSTSKNQEISHMFAESSGSNRGSIGVFFEITVNPSVSSVSFALLDEVSSFSEENEILFSMHTIFRINEIKQMEGRSGLWHVKLILTSDNDQQLNTLTEQIRKETEGYTGWDRLGRLLIKIGEFNKAEEVYRTLFYQTSDIYLKAYLCNQLGMTLVHQGNIVEGISFYEKTLELYRNILPLNHPLLATTYNNIGGVYEQIGELVKALSFHQKALAIRQNALPDNHLELAISYSNISAIHAHTGEYLKALSYCEKALNIYVKSLPENHPDLAKCFNNIGDIYGKMNQYSEAIPFYEKALEIRLKILPPNHPSLAVSYDSFGSMYIMMGNYSKALSFYEKALYLRQKSLPSNDLLLGVSYNNIGEVYRQIGEYSKAFSFFQKDLEISEKIFSPNCPQLATSYQNIGLIYDSFCQFSEALLYYYKALKILQKSFSPDHPSLVSVFIGIGSAYDNLGHYPKALTSYEKAIDILQKNLSSNHPSLAYPYAGIGIIHDKMGEYSKALKFHEKALEIRQNTLPPNHPFLATSYHNIGTVYYAMKDYWKALPFFDRAIDIAERSLPSNHPELLNYKMYLEDVRNKLIKKYPE